MARAVAAARRAAVLEHHVPDLGAGSDEAAVRLAVEDQPAADAGPEREHDHVVRALPGADLPLGDRGCVAVVVEGDRDWRTAPQRGRESRSRRAERAPSRRRGPCAGRSSTGARSRSRATPSPRSSSTISSSSSRNSSRDSRRSRPLDPMVDLALAVDHPGRDLRPADVDTDGPFGHAATIRRRMAQGEKPYRVYRGGRVKGRVPTLGQAGARTGANASGRRAGSRAPGRSSPRPKRERNWGRWIGIGVAVVLRPRARVGRRQLPLHCGAARRPRTSGFPHRRRRHSFRRAG